MVVHALGNWFASGLDSGSPPTLCTQLPTNMVGGTISENSEQVTCEKCLALLAHKTEKALYEAASGSCLACLGIGVKLSTLAGHTFPCGECRGTGKRRPRREGTVPWGDTF